MDFYPRPPRGGRRRRGTHRVHLRNFYPRPPRGGRPFLAASAACCGVFLSTPSARRATQRMETAALDVLISIHALREEGDPRLRRYVRQRRHFYPRPPRGGRPWPCTRCWRTINFYPRPPRGGRPRRAEDGRTPSRISIHALREEGDLATLYLPVSGSYFYPRPPRGGRPEQVRFRGVVMHFYPRPPRGGRPTPACTT